MIATWKKILVFFKLYELDNQALSLTSIAMWLVLVRLAMASQPSIADLTAFFLACLARGHQKELESRGR